MKRIAAICILAVMLSTMPIYAADSSAAQQLQSDNPQLYQDLQDLRIARIISVADTYDAMTTNRPYHNALDEAKAIAELKRCAGLQFEKDVVDAFIQAYENGEIKTGVDNNAHLINTK